MNNDFQRKGIRFNVDHEVTKLLKIKVMVRITQVTIAYSSGSLQGSSQFLIGAARMAALPANISPYNEDGSYNLSSTLDK